MEDNSDILGFISSKTLDVNDTKEQIQNIFSSNSIRIKADVLNEIISLIEEIMDNVNHDCIKEFLMYLSIKYNFKFIREHTEELVLFDEDVTILNEVY